MSDLVFVAADTGPSLSGSIVNVDGTPFDLTDCAVRFQMRLVTDRRWLVDAIAVIVGDETAGTVRYDWAEGDLATPGEMSSRWRIEFIDGTIIHTEPENTLTVEPQ